MARIHIDRKDLPGPLSSIEGLPPWRHRGFAMPGSVPAAWGPQDRPSDVDLVIVGESPGRVELERGHPFVGPSGVLLKTAVDKLQEALGTNLSMFVMNVFPAGRPQDEQTAWKEAHALRKAVQRTIHDANPRAVLALGRFAAVATGWQQELGDPAKYVVSGLGEWVPYVERVWYASSPESVVPTVLAPHPSAVLRKPDKFLPKFTGALEHLLEILRPDG